MSDNMDKKLREKIKIRQEAHKNMEHVRKFSTEQLQAKIEEPDMKLFLNDISSGKVKGTASKQETLSARGYMAELYEPFSEEFINWLFKHLHKEYKETCSKDFIDRVLEPQCVKRLYSDMFKSSESQTDDLLFETAVIASEIDDGIPFEEGLKSLERRLKSGSSRSELNVDRNEKKIAMALYDFSGGSKNQISFRKEDLFLVEQSSGKC